MDNGNMPLFEAADEEPIAEKPRKKAGSIQVVLIQSACCAVFLLLFWLFKVLGGSAYDQLKTAFQTAFQNNALLATVSGLFDEQTPDDAYVMQGGTTAPTTTGTAVGDSTEGKATTGTAAASGTTAAASDHMTGGAATATSAESVTGATGVDAETQGSSGA